MGDKFFLRLNMNGRLIVNKYCEGKMKRILERELRDLKLLGRKVFVLDWIYVQSSCESGAGLV